MTPNQKAFLHTIAASELGLDLIGETDNGYNVLVGSTAANPHTFCSYADHPRVSVALRPGLVSTAAGRYQLLARFFDFYKTKLHLPDFSPASQDAIALQQINERNAFGLIEAGKFGAAVVACSSIWASLPGNSYGQHQQSLQWLQSVYVANGGKVAP